MLKRILSMVLCVVLVAGALVLPVSADVGDYRFSEREPNDSHSYADRVYDDYTISGSAGYLDIDYYKFVLSSRSNVYLACACSYSTILVGIENSSGTAVYANQPTSYSGSTYTFAGSIVLNAGTYYIGVLSSNKVSYSKTYMLYLDYTATASSHTHTYSNACDSTCNTCGATRSVSHSYKAATCTNPKVCSICGTTSGSALGHTYQNDCDESCDRCDAKRTVSGHIYANDCDTTCDVCGETRSVQHAYDNGCDTTCNICGAERTIQHGYDNDCDAFCNVCGEQREVGDHKYSNACDASCNICGSVRPVSDHVYSSPCDATCNICNAERTADAHQYENSCDDACDICGETRSVQHAYDNGCDTVCNVCGAERTIQHTYDNACDASCNVCGEQREVGDHKYSNACDATCDLCNAKRNVDHKYKTTTTKATLKKDGSVVKKCTVCGSVVSKKVIKYPKTITLSASSAAYDKKVKTPSVVVKDSAGKTLKKDTDYTVTYEGGRKNVGTYKVTVTMKGNYSGSKVLSFAITPTTKTSASLFVGEKLKIGAKSDKSIKYTTSNKSVATVSSKGEITAKKAGTVTITVKSNGVTQAIKVTVKAPTIKISGTNTITVKQAVTLKAATNPSGKVKWSTSSKKIATVSSSGKVTGVKAGTATISAKFTYKGKSYTAKFKITVKNPVLEKTSASLDVGKTTQIKVKGGTGAITYSSSNKSVATVSSSGVVKAVKPGSCTITVKRNGVSMSFKVTVNKPSLEKTSATLYAGQTTQIKVKGGSGTVTYSSSNKAVATVSSSGVVTAVKKGSCTITAKRNGISMTFKVTVKERDYSKITLYEDSNVRVTFKSAEKSKYSADRAELYFYVENKTRKTWELQADAVSLNGYSFCNIVMSDPVAPYSTGVINMSVEDFDFGLVNLNAITSIGGQLRIIDQAAWKGYDALFANTRLDGKGAYSRTSAPNDNLLYSDSNCEIYYKSIKEDKYDDTEAEMYLFVVNKSNKTLEIQADTISINGYSHSDLIMSDPVLPKCVGIVNVSIDDFRYDAISLNNIRMLGGQLRIIDQAAWKGYDAVFYNKPVY